MSNKSAVIDTLKAMILVATTMLAALVVLHLSKADCESWPDVPEGFELIYSGRNLAASKLSSIPSLIIVRSRLHSLIGYSSSTLHTLVDTAKKVALPYVEAIVEILINYGFRNVLLLGLGGGAIPLLYSERCHDCSMTAVDVDPDALAITRKFVKRDDNSTMHYVNQCASEYIKTAQTAQYDAVINDLALGASPPDFVYDQSFIGNISRILKPTGQYIISTFDHDRSKAFKAVSGMMGHVGMIRPDGRGKTVLLASKARHQGTP